MESNGYKTLDYKECQGLIKSVTSEIRNLGPIEIGGVCRRHWNALKEPTIVDLKKRVVKKKKKTRAKSVKKQIQNPPAAADPQVEALGQAPAPAQAADQAPPGGPEAMDVAAVGNPNVQLPVGPGGATGGPPPPTNPQRSSPPTISIRPPSLPR